MAGFLELIPARAIAAIGLLILTGCSSGGSSGLLQSLWQSGDDTEQVAEVTNPADTITRGRIDQMGVALIRVREMRTNEQNLLVAFRQSGEQITYVLRADRRLVMHGGLIQSTYGFGKNLQPVSVRRSDPVAYPRPLKDWPDRINRSYQIADRGLEPATRLVCSFTIGAADNLEIVGRTVVVQPVRETCSGGGVSFINRHDVAPSTGFIWRSRQWTGDVQGSLIYEILEPLD